MHQITEPFLGALLLAVLGMPPVSGQSDPLLEKESLWLRSQGGTAGLYGPGPDPATADSRETAGPQTPHSGGKPESSARDNVSKSRLQTRNELLGEVDYGWTRPQVFSREADDSTRDDDGLVRDRLESVFIPSIEFREMPLSEVVNSLSATSVEYSPDGSGMNIVLIDPESRDPRVSIILRRLNLKRVLDFVTESVGYEYDLQQDAVVIRPRQGPGLGLETEFYPISRSTLIRLTGLQGLESSAPVDPLGDPFAEPEPQSAGQGSDAEQALKSFLQRAGIPFGGIPGADLALADGQLIVTQTPRNQDKVRQLLRRYREVKQVEIEARFLEVEERNLEELGLEWTLVTAGGDRLSNAPTRNLANAFTIGEDESRVVIDRPGVDLPAIGQGAPVLPMTVDLAENAGNLLQMSGVIGQNDLEVIIRALERQSGNDLLSAPKLTVLSGKTAEIVVAEEFRYPEMYGDTNAEVGRGDSNSGSAGVAITAGTPRSFATRNVGVEMEVTPAVEDDNSISLRLKPKVTEFEGFVEYGGTSVAIASDTTVTVPSGFYQPVFSVRRLQTEVTIWDGATVVMGGLTREHAVRISDRVPILGDIPLLGRLFRTEGESTQKRNLLIFVTANLVSPGGSPAFQYLPGVEPNSLFQVPRAATPEGLKDR